MNIAEMLPVDAVVPDLKAKTPNGVFEELLVPLERAHPGLLHDQLVETLCAREKMGSTAVGDGVAIPHGKVPGLEHVLLAVGRSLEGIDFGAPDKQLCHIFFLILAPEQGAGAHLKLLAQIARRAKDSVFRSEVMLADDSAQIMHALTAP